MKKASKSSSLSVLDQDLIRELVIVAETAVKSHLTTLLHAKVNNEDDEVQVIEEKPSLTVLPLKLPKPLQIRIIEQLKSKGKSADKIDIINLASELFSKTLKNVEGMEVTNCSLRISSNSSENLKRRRTSLTVDNLPEKRAKRSRSLNNNSSLVKETEKENEKNVVLWSNRKSLSSQSSTSKQNNGNFAVPANNQIITIKRPVGRPRKTPIIPTVVSAKQTKSRFSRRVRDHSLKSWPYQPYQPAAAAASKAPAIKRKLSGPHRESLNVRALRKVPIFQGSFVHVSFLRQMFSDFQMDLKHLMALLNTCFGDCSEDLQFSDAWQLTHLSVRAVQTLLDVLFAEKKRVIMLSQVLAQLTTLPSIAMRKVSLEEKVHLSQLSKNEFCNLFALGPTRMSTRTKIPTQKFQDSPCSTSMAALSSSITTPPKKSPSISRSRSREKSSKSLCYKLTKEDLVLSLQKGWIKGRLRPRFRHLIFQAKRTKRKAAAIKAEPPVKTDLSFLDNLNSNEVNGDTEIIVVEDDSATVIDVTDMSSRLVDFERIDHEGVIKVEETDEEAPQRVINSRLAVRKFPSYGWNREKEARIKIQITEEKELANGSSRSKAPTTTSKPLDFPVFQLSGLSETAPKEVEGWFTSKVSLLRKLSEQPSIPSSKSSSPSSSRSGSVQKKKKSRHEGKVPVKVFLDQNIETIVDLPEYKLGLEQIKEIIEEIESATANGDNTDQEVITETLRVARKIEKISISGIGKQVSLPSPASFLPPGWHCRKVGQDWEYVNNDGLKVKSIQAAIKHETAQRLINSSSSKELL